MTLPRVLSSDVQGDGVAGCSVRHCRALGFTPALPSMDVPHQQSPCGTPATLLTQHQTWRDSVKVLTDVWFGYAQVCGVVGVIGFVWRFWNKR